MSDTRAARLVDFRAAVPTSPGNPREPPSTLWTVRELVVLAIGAIGLAVAMFWPLVLHLGSELPKDLGDPLAQAWQLAWGGHALVNQPLDFFQSNQFWPGGDTLALSDALVGYAPLPIPGHGVEAAVARYDVVFLFANAMALAGAYVLARELGLGPAAACVAGVAFAYSPWRLEQGGHLQILSSGAIPLAIALLIGGYRRGRGALVYAGWAVVAWQVSIGFSLGLPLLLGLLAGAPLVWWRSGRPVVAPRATAAGIATVVVVTALLAVPYLHVRSDEPDSRRSPETVATYSVGPRAFATASSLNPVWGPVTAPLRKDLPAVAEQTLFPGIATLLLAALGAAWTAWPRGLRGALLGAVGVFAVLSLGFEVHGLGRFLPYRALYELVPGWSGIRVPERLHTFTTLALALLSAGGIARLTARRASVARWIVPLALLAVLAEGAGFGPGRWYPHLRAPAPPAGLANLADPLLALPASATDSRRYLLWSTDGFPRLVNGRSSITPRRTTRILEAVTAFPDRASVAALRRLEVRTVVLHADRLMGTPWERWQARPVAGLGIARRIVGRLVVYDLR
jgi:hypothetical protein